LDVNDWDRLIACGTVSIAAGTIAIIFATRPGHLAAIFVWIFAVIAIAAFAALPWSWYRRAVSWLGSKAPPVGAWLRLSLLRREPSPQLPTAALTASWRFTTDAMMHPQLARIAQDGFSHLAHARPIEATPHYVRVKALVACSQLEDGFSWQGLRGRFLGLMAHEWVMTLISELTVIPDTASWQPRATSRRSWLEADLTGPDPEKVPVASAKLLLPEVGPGLMGTDHRCAELTLHVDLVQSQELVVTIGEGQGFKSIIEGLPFWRGQIRRALTMPGDLDGFLRSELGLTTTNDPPAQFGILLKAQKSITEIVNPGNIRALTATPPYVVNEYIGYAIADAKGRTVDDLAGEIMLDLSQRVLYLDGSQDEMSGLPAGAASEDGLGPLRRLAVEGQVMRSRVPPRNERGLFDFPPRDLLTRFESWKTEVGGALRPWPDLLNQFQSEPVQGPGIWLNRASEPHWREIEHRTNMLTSIVKALEG
jgi:hypothetical protein